ncbi:hypothetical protein EI94DRAFT_1916572 [Lactarius quietus]|nr:hypothetical protein EI94DRAFT_1916572 [Lactarius quietus]
MSSLRTHSRRAQAAMGVWPVDLVSAGAHSIPHIHAGLHTTPLRESGFALTGREIAQWRGLCNIWVEPIRRVRGHEPRPMRIGASLVSFEGVPTLLPQLSKWAMVPLPFGDAAWCSSVESVLDKRAANARIEGEEGNGTLNRGERGLETVLRSRARRRWTVRVPVNAQAKGLAAGRRIRANENSLIQKSREFKEKLGERTASVRDCTGLRLTEANTEVNVGRKTMVLVPNARPSYRYTQTKFGGRRSKVGKSKCVKDRSNPVLIEEGEVGRDLTREG